MSEDMALICTACKELIWIGQEGGLRFTLYSGEKHTMETLRRFLIDHRYKEHPLIFDIKQRHENCAEISAEKTGEIYRDQWPNDTDALVRKPLGNIADGKETLKPRT